MLNNVIDLLFVLLFFYSLLLGIYGLLGNVVTLKKKEKKNKQNGEDVTILLLRDTVTASWRAYVRASFRIKDLLLNRHLESGLVFLSHSRTRT